MPLPNPAAAIPTVVLAGLLTAGAGFAGDSHAGTTDGLAAAVTISDGGIPGILPGAVPGDPARGRDIVANRQVGLCLLCHSAPIPEERFQGDLATDLAGAGDRATAAQLRLRIADPSRLNPETIMPSYFKVEGLNRVGATFQGKPILGAQQIEDVVAWLLTLREVSQ
jgi:L-cysteine S-thiosulfotransferase